MLPQPFEILLASRPLAASTTQLQLQRQELAQDGGAIGVGRPLDEVLDPRAGPGLPRLFKPVAQLVEEADQGARVGLAPPGGSCTHVAVSSSQRWRIRS